MDNDLRINRRDKDGATSFQLVPKAAGVYQVAVVGDGQVSLGIFHGDRLGVAQLRGTGGGISNVADGGLAGKLLESRLVKNISDESHTLVIEEVPIFHGADTGGFLASVLERVKA